jgi:FAD/FMN-containing dehydrogenase
MEIKQHCQKMAERLNHLDWITSPVHLRRLSRDFHWFSPVLTEQLSDKWGDIAVKPRNESELRQIVSECVTNSIPMIVRGGGTGNYGQSVPLNGGVVVDMTHYNQVHWVKEGVASVAPGIKIAALESHLGNDGYEMRCMPSTYKLATLGGLFSGGFGGVGSINYGPLSAPGTLLKIRLMTIEKQPQILEFAGQDVLTYHHTYGTNGIIVEMQIALAPKRDWDEYMLAFPGLETAFMAANTLAYSPGIEKRNVALFDSQSAGYLPHGNSITDAEYLVIALITPNGRAPLEQLISRHHGRIVWQQSSKEAEDSRKTLIESCWNHSTLHAIKHDKTLTYLQAMYDQNEAMNQLKHIQSVTKGEVNIHLEFIKNGDGQSLITGLPLIHYTTKERLADLIEIHRQAGIHINDPHVYTLEDGKHSGALSEAILQSKRRHDPNDLLNRGKIRSLSSLNQPMAKS